MHKRHSWKGIEPVIMTAVTAGALGLLGTTGNLQASDDWKLDTISPVTNPVFFEDPQVNSEVRPIFAYHNIDNDFVTQGGAVQLYAVQLRWAVTERFALIAVKDGYINFDPDAGLPKTGGWADLAAGFKYALVDNKEAQFIVTPGLTIELPTGNTRVFQGNGDGTWNPFISAGKGFGNFHITGNFGGIIPNNFAEETAQIHYSLQLDYKVHQYFIPFAAINGFTVLSEGTAIPLDVEGFDLINFGASEANGFTQVVTGVGFRSRILESLDVGFAYEFPITSPRGLFGDRFTVDLIWRF